MRTEPKFVTPADFYNYFGEDLNHRLRGADNESNKANLFLLRVEDWMLAWIDANTFRTYKWEQVRGSDLEHLQKAILIQARYIAINGEMNFDSGYDPDRGLIIDKGKLQSVTICDGALNELKVSGLYNHRITNRRRYIRWN